MAVILDTTSSGRSETAGTTLTVSHTCTGLDRILVAYVAHRDTPNSGNDPTGVTYNLIAMTLVSNTADGGQVSGNWWYLIAPTTGANDIVATWGETVDNRMIMAHSYTGALQSGQVNASGGRQSSNEAAGTVRTVTLTQIVPSCMIVGAVCQTHNAAITSSPHILRISLMSGANLNGVTADRIKTLVALDTLDWTRSSWEFDSTVMRNIAISPSNYPSFKENKLRPRIFAPGLAR